MHQIHSKIFFFIGHREFPSANDLRNCCFWSTCSGKYHLSLSASRLLQTKRAHCSADHSFVLSLQPIHRRTSIFWRNGNSPTRPTWRIHRLACICRDLWCRCLLSIWKRIVWWSCGYPRLVRGNCRVS